MLPTGQLPRSYLDSARDASTSARRVCAAYLLATDRRGQAVSVPLVTLSVAAVPVESVQTAEHPGALAQMAASLKRKVKEMTAERRQSAFLYERRRLRPVT